MEQYISNLSVKDDIRDLEIPLTKILYVKKHLNIFNNTVHCLKIIQFWLFSRLSFTSMSMYFLLGIIISPAHCFQKCIYSVFRLTFGTLYPAYASYKAVRTKNVKEYVKWMMYWIVYAFFTCIETITDIFLSWFPFYYEIKVVIVLWLLSPATKGSSTLYRKFVHPMLTRREQEIDEYINQAKEKGYSAVLQLGYTGVNYAKNVIMQSALKYAFGTANEPQRINTLPQSYSDNAIHERRVMNDCHDAPFLEEQYVPKSQSLTAMSTVQAEFSEDEQVASHNVDLHACDRGAARIRERKINSLKQKNNLKSTAKLVNTRRGKKLREATPDQFIDVE